MCGGARMKIAVVGDHETTLGFSLAGVKLIMSVQNAEETINAVDYFLSYHDVGVILLQDRMARPVRAYLANKMLKKNVYPIILEIEGITGPDESADVSKTDIPRNDTDPGTRRSGYG
jgi:vacuolar-type H+-ATPase subunit F/Vma7